MIYTLCHYFHLTPDEVRSVPYQEVATMVEVMHRIRKTSAGGS